MPPFRIPGFNRRYILIPVLAAIVLIATVSYVTEQRRTVLMDSATDIAQSQERLRLLAELAYAAADVESEQRGFMLTQASQYLQPYAEATHRMFDLLPELKLAYRGRPEDKGAIDQLQALVQSKLAESDAAVKLVGSEAGMTLREKNVQADSGLHWMRQIRSEVEVLRDAERERVYQGIDIWRRQHQLAGTINVLSSVLVAVLLVVSGIFLTRDIERRNAAVTELDKLVALRTRELSELSTHLQGVTEREKSQLARELHDELGGLLVAIKMDLGQLAKKLDIKHPDILPRWQRIQDAISAGVELKRRVIEELRPTLLDNMGLIAALRWQAEQSCNHASVTLKASFPEEEPVLNTDTAIAIFRVAQEALTNIIKHSHATMVQTTLTITPSELQLIIEDDGVGIAPHTQARSGKHGLLSMRHRIEAIGGTFQIEPAMPKGTKVIVKVPEAAMAAAREVALPA